MITKQQRSENQKAWLKENGLVRFSTSIEKELRSSLVKILKAQKKTLSGWFRSVVRSYLKACKNKPQEDSKS